MVKKTIKNRRLIKTNLARNIVAGTLTLGLGILITFTIKQNDSPVVLSAAREGDLVKILDDLNNQSDALESELVKQTRLLETLKNGSSVEVTAAAQERLDQLLLLAGVTPVSGSGIKIVISGDTYAISAYTLLNIIQELRDAGAVAIQINKVRIINSTYFTDTEIGIKVNNTAIRSPFNISVLGDGATLETALKIPGGVAESITTSGGQITIDKLTILNIESVVPLESPKYAVDLVK